MQFVVTFPPDFARELVRGEHPLLLVEADATDPAATGNALVGAAAGIAQTALDARPRRAAGAISVPAPPPVDVRVHRRYNPEGITAYNIVPGLLGVILTMTMVLMTGLAMTRERERGTFENLLVDAGAAARGDDRQDRPVHPDRADPGDADPARRAVHLPRADAAAASSLLYGVVLVFIAANLTLGITFSSIARNQLQAMQMTFFFFLPSILLSGFMFPFRGMPDWAQVIGSVLPLTHFLVLVRGILLKGIALHELWPHVWPMLAFMLAVIAARAEVLPPDARLRRSRRTPGHAVVRGPA